jgi:hypothetical protein
MAMPDKALEMRTLAARLRAQAAQTGVALFRRKLEGVASELEEAAIDADSRQSHRPN